MSRGIKFIFTFLCCLLFSSYAFSKNEQSLDQIVAVVNNTVITQSELDQAIYKVKKQLESSRTTLPTNEILQHQVLDQLINRKLQLDLAEQAGIRITDADVTKTIAEIAKGNHLSITQLYNKVATQGLNQSDYRDEIRDEITLQKIQGEMVGSKITISPDEVNDFMRSAAWQEHNSKEYHLEDILITLPEEPSTQQVIDAKKRAQDIVNKLHNGTSFREAAISESGGSKALQGGDLGWRRLPEVPSAFASQILQANQGDIIGPIQAPNGFHIIHVTGIRNVNMHGNSANQHRQVQELLFQRKYEEALQTWITKLRSEAYINTHPEN